MTHRAFSTVGGTVRRRKVGILGCTGVVGQRFIQLLDKHPWFELHRVTASQKSTGKQLKDVLWKLPTPMPMQVRDFPVLSTTPESLDGCEVVFSALDSSIAGEAESALAHRGYAVFSNAKNHRMDPNVPLLIPAANAPHIKIVPKRTPSKGFIVTNANCASTGLAIALAPLQQAFGVKQMAVFTMQAVSGAGYPGVPSLDIMDNVIPYIGGEEEKLETELHKILGKPGGVGGVIQSLPANDLIVSAHCNRVPVLDGHTECVSIKFNKPGVTPAQVIDKLKSYQCPTKTMNLPMALPSSFPPIVYLENDDRPQPRLDRDNGQGFSVTVGRVRKCPLMDVKLTLLSHNTVVGAAGGSIFNAELAVALGLC